MKAAEGCHPGGGATTTPRGVAEEGVLEVDEGEPGEQLLGRRGPGLAGSAVKRVLRVESAATAATVEPCPRSSVKGWAKVWLLTPARGQVGVADDGLGRPGQLQARGQWRRRPARSRGGVHPGPAVGLEPGAAQHLVAPVELRADFAGDAGLGERGDVDGHVGLVEHLVAAERGQLVERVLARRARAPRSSVLTASGLTASVVATSRCVRQRVGHGGRRRPAVTGTTTPTRRARRLDRHGVRLLIGEERGEAGERGRRALTARARPRRGRRRWHVVAGRRAAQGHRAARRAGRAVPGPLAARWRSSRAGRSRRRRPSGRRPTR